MSMDIIKRFLLMLLLALVQALVFNRIHLFSCATLFLYLLFPLTFSTSMPRWAALLWCFTLGLSVDVFGNTPGLAAASLTLIGAIQPYLLNAFISREESEDFRPSLKTLRWTRYSAYTLIITVIYCLVFFTIEAFSFFDVVMWIESVAGSILFTYVVLMLWSKIEKG